MALRVRGKSRMRSVLQARGYVAGILKSIFNGRPATILIAEPDGVRWRHAYRALSQNYRIVHAATIEEAVRAGARHKPEIDLLLTEARLPDGTGWDLTGLLKLDYPDVGVVYLSSAVDGEIRAHTRRDVLVEWKSPFNADRLRQAISDVLEAKRKARQAAKSSTGLPPLSRLLRWVP